MSEIFISYARTTEPQARAIAEALRALGYGVWRDDELPAHRTFAEVIEERLTAAKAVVVVWSADAAKSEWVQAEADRARRDHKIVQMSIDGTKPPMPFDRLQCAGFAGWTGEPDNQAWKIVVESIAELVGREPRPGAAPPIVPPIRAKLRRPRLAFVAAGVAVVLVALAGAWIFLRTSPSAAAPVEVAILPFDAVGSGPARAFADAQLDAMVDMAAKQQVPLVSRTESAALHGAGADQAIARLGVTLLVDGLVEVEGDTVKVTVHLEDARNHVTLWSRQITGSLKDAANLQARVAAHIADEITVAMYPEARAKLDPQTMAAWLEGSDELSNETGGRATTIFREVVAKAPDFSHGHTELATSLLVLDYAAAPPENRAAILAEIESECALAKKIDPTNGESYQVRAMVYPFSDYSRREAEILKGLSIDSTHPYLPDTFSGMLIDVGRTAEATVMAKRATDAEPYFNYPRRDLAFDQALAGLPDEAARSIDQAYRMWPDNDDVRRSDFQVSVLSRPARALTLLDDPAFAPLIGGRPAIPLWRTALHALVSGDAGSKRAASATLRAAPPGALPPGWAMTLLAGLGDMDDAFAKANSLFTTEWLRQPQGIYDPVAALLFSPLTGQMRRDPRFMPLMARMGLVDYWRKSGHWPDFCAEPGLPYDCRAQKVAAR